MQKQAESVAEGATDNAAAAEGAASEQGQEAPKTGLEAKLEAAAGDPELLQDLAGEILKELRSTRKEAKSRRERLQELEQVEADRLAADEQRKLEEMSELERIQAQNKTLQEQLEQQLELTSESAARADFMAAGAADVDSVLLHWKALNAEAKAAQSPADWAKALKESKPHLFQQAQQPAKPLGPNPRAEQAKPSGKPVTMTTHPKTEAEARDVLQNFRNTYR